MSAVHCWSEITICDYYQVHDTPNKSRIRTHAPEDSSYILANWHLVLGNVREAAERFEPANMETKLSCAERFVASLYVRQAGFIRKR